MITIEELIEKAKLVREQWMALPETDSELTQKEQLKLLSDRANLFGKMELLDELMNIIISKN